MINGRLLLWLLSAYMLEENPKESTKIASDKSIKWSIDQADPCRNPQVSAKQ